LSDQIDKNFSLAVQAEMAAQSDFEIARGSRPDDGNRGYAPVLALSQRALQARADAP
jgi:hypothetical protein